MNVGFSGKGRSMDMFDSPLEKKRSKTSSDYGMQMVLNPLHTKEVSDMAHASTILHQAPSLVPRPEFETLAREHGTRHACSSSGHQRAGREDRAGHPAKPPCAQGGNGRSGRLPSGRGAERGRSHRGHQALNTAGRTENPRGMSMEPPRDGGVAASPCDGSRATTSQTSFV